MLLKERKEIFLGGMGKSRGEQIIKGNYSKFNFSHIRFYETWRKFYRSQPNVSDTNVGKIHIAVMV